MFAPAKIFGTFHGHGRELRGESSSLIRKAHAHIPLLPAFIFVLGDHLPIHQRPHHLCHQGR